MEYSNTFKPQLATASYLYIIELELCCVSTLIYLIVGNSVDNFLFIYFSFSQWYSLQKSISFFLCNWQNCIKTEISKSSFSPFKQYFTQFEFQTHFYILNSRNNGFSYIFYVRNQWIHKIQGEVYILVYSVPGVIISYESAYIQQSEAVCTSKENSKLQVCYVSRSTCGSLLPMKNKIHHR